MNKPLTHVSAVLFSQQTQNSYNQDIVRKGNNKLSSDTRLSGGGDDDDVTTDQPNKKVPNFRSL